MTILIQPRKTRRPRRREELPDPSKPPHHSTNQIQPLFAARVEPEMKRRIDEWIAAHGITKRAATEYAFELAMKVTAYCVPKPPNWG